MFAAHEDQSSIYCLGAVTERNYVYDESIFLQVY